MELPSKIVEEAISELGKLPGIGKKTALRLALHILKQTEGDAQALGEAIISLRKNIVYCKKCGNISDQEICNICSSPRREKSIICVVEDCKDVIALENTGQYQGVYHVLGGLVNPLAGIAPSQLNISPLIEQVQNGNIEEVIFALSASIEGDTTSFYIARQLEGLPVKLTHIARGIPVGSELEFTDEITLARSLMNRTTLNKS